MLFDERSPFARIGPYMWPFLVLGITVPMLLYILVMMLLGWQNPSIGGTSNNYSFRANEEAIYLFEVPATSEYFARIGGNYQNLLEPWRGYFKDQSRAHKVLKSAAEISKLKSGVLILASAIALTEADRSAIAQFRARGGAVLATWATGTRDERGEWVGWKFLEELGATSVAEMPKLTEPTYLVVHGESPVTFTHSSGQRIAFANATESYLSIKGQHVASRFLNAERREPEERRGQGAVVYAEGKINASRAVIFAFAESAWVAQPSATHVVIEDAVKWLSHDIAVVKAAWPNGRQAAQVIQMDIEEEPINALIFASAMKEARLPSSFFVLSSVVQENSKLIESLAVDFEMGFHGDINSGFKGTDLVAQRSRLVNMRMGAARSVLDLRNWIGFRAPAESFPKASESLLAQAGLRYQSSGPSRSEARLPVFAKLADTTAQDDLLILPRTQPDDAALLGRNLSEEQLTESLLADLEDVRLTGALGWLNIHSQNFIADSKLHKAFAQYIKQAKALQAQVWFANAAQVNAWWRDRERIKVSSQFDGKRLDFGVSVAEGAAVKGSSFIVMLPFKAAQAVVRPVKIGVELPTVKPLDSLRTLLSFDALSPGNYDYTITFTPK